MTPYDATAKHLAEVFGEQLEDMDLDEKYTYGCALVYAITDMGQGKNADDAWEASMDVYDEGMFDENVFADLEGGCPSVHDLFPV